MGYLKAFLLAVVLVAGGGCAAPWRASSPGEGRAGGEKPVLVEVPWLRVTVQDVPRRVAEYYELGEPRGAVVTSVDPEGPGKAAGLEWGDVILAVDEVQLTDPRDLASWSGVLSRDRVVLGIMRSGSYGKVEVTLPEKGEVGGTEAGPSEEGGAVRTERQGAVGRAGVPGAAQEVGGAEPPPGVGASGSDREPREGAGPGEPPAEEEEGGAGDGESSRLEERAYSMYVGGRLDEAKGLYQELVRRNPRDATAYGNLGVVLNRLGRPEEALAVLERALTLDPGFAQAHYNRGLALWSTGRFEEALAAYRSATAAAPGLVEARLAQADLLLQLGRAREALQANSAALEYAPEEASVWRQRGEVLRALHRLEDAERAYRKALERDPRDGATRLALGILLDEEGRYPEALETYDALVSSGAAGPSVFHNRALLRLHLGDASGALRDADRAVEVEPDFHAAHAVRARALTALGRIEEAVRAWGRAMGTQRQRLEALEELDRLARGLIAHSSGIRDLQRWLVQAGHPAGEVDGIWGEATRAALRGFQKEAGLSPTGRLNGLTLLELVSAVSPREGAALD
ncbi:MAG: hypothetical protein Kow0092_21730 [Deferrisomatales bacterium]